MSKKEETDSDGNPDYEDDFEKDLDWLINEDAEKQSGSEHQNVKEQLYDVNPDSTNLVEERNESDRSPNSNKHNDHDEANFTLGDFSEYEEADTEDEEAKRYIAEKIEEANRKLEMESVDENRQRKLKFKDGLVDLEVPPMEFPDSHRSDEEDVLDSFSQLRVSDVPERNKEHPDKVVDIDPKDIEPKDIEPKEGKVLVEKDGKFELVSIQDIENQCSLPPINSHGDSIDGKKISSDNISNLIPHQPLGSKGRPSSSCNLMKPVHKGKPPRRVQSASVSTGHTTYCLSPEQKEVLKRIQERQEKLRKQAEERKKEEEEQKRRENELAFKLWLQKKKEQINQERKIKQAKQLEETSIPDEEKEPEAFTQWLKKKHREQMTEKKMEELRKQEFNTFLQERKNGEKAFAEWLSMKRKQRRAEHQASMERSRRLLQEARRRKQIQNLQFYNISDPKPFCYMSR